MPGHSCRTRVVLALRALVVASLFGAVLSARTHTGDLSWAAVLGMNLAFSYTWATLALVIVTLDRRLVRRGVSLASGLAIHAVVGLAVAVASIYLDRLYETLLRVPGASIDLSLEPLRRAAQWGVGWLLTVYWAILGARRAFHYYSRYRERAVRAAELEKLLAQSQLQVLRMQLEPHFLFNALNTISAHVETDPRLARRMLEKLGELLRLSLDCREDQEVPLSEELGFLDHYLAIQKARFEERLEVDLRIAPDTLDALVPSLLLQPLVENAIRHGLSQRVQEGRVSVAAERDGKDLKIRISDDGVGLTVSGNPLEAAGLGLSITRKRLDRLYPGGLSGLEIRNGRKAGTIVEIRIPWRTRGREDVGAQAEAQAHG